MQKSKEMDQSSMQFNNDGVLAVLAVSNLQLSSTPGMFQQKA
jgi:hypothetical protein